MVTSMQVQALSIWRLIPTAEGRRIWPPAVPLVIACAIDDLDAREFAMQACAPVIDMAATQMNFLKLANFWRDARLVDCQPDTSGEWPADIEGVLFPTPSSRRAQPR